jgi:hypothetical protein
MTYSQFHSIQHAIALIPRCIFCREYMVVENEYRDSGWDSSGLPRRQIKFTNRDTSWTDEYILSFHSPGVERNISYHRSEIFQPLGSIDTTLSFPRSSVLPDKGHQYLAVGVRCASCSDYQYTIQVVIDLEQLLICRINLNSETLVFRKEVERYVVRNIYTLEQTEYSYDRFGGVDDGVKQQIFPLLPLDRDNPHKILERVRSLLIWT